MLWACLYFSDLPLRAVFEDSEQALPCAVVDGPRQRPHIVLANAPARKHGIDTGRVLAASRALCSTLQARTRDRPGEQRLLLSLAAWAYRFSSHVSLCEPDALLVEVGASLRLFGGWPALERRLRRELAAIGHAPAIAVAPLPAAARVLAARHDGFFTDQREPMLTALGCIAIAGSGLDGDTISLLYNVGARTLRDAFALPRPELARRIGPAALARLDRLRGIDHEVLPLYQPPDRFEHRIELDDRVEAWPPLLFPLRRLCGELALFLTARDGGVQRCDLVLDHEDQPATRVTVELLTPQREARTLYELVRSRLERVALTAPVCGIALAATDLPEFRPRHQDLFEPQREQGLEWPELAERLRAHLGDDAVRRLAAAADHRPERAWCFATVNQADPRPRPSPLPQARVKVAHGVAISEALPHSAGATLNPALSRQRERGKSGDLSPNPVLPSNFSPIPLAGSAGDAATEEEMLPSSDATFTPAVRLGVVAAIVPPLPLAGEAAPQARVRVAHDVATAETSRTLCAPAIADAWFRFANVPAIGGSPPPSANATATAETTSQYATTSLSSLRLSADQERSAEPDVSAADRSPFPPAQAGDGSGQAAIPGAASARHPASPSAAARDALTCDVPVACPSGQLRYSQRQSCRCNHGIAQAAQLRPLWLLRRALPLRGAAPRILAGPERIESGWWDGGDTRRDYYVVQTREGQRAWAFLVPGTSDGWMLHGWFA